MTGTCSCGTVEGLCEVGHNPRVTWTDAAGERHVNGLGVVMDPETLAAHQARKARLAVEGGDLS